MDGRVGRCARPGALPRLLLDPRAVLGCFDALSCSRFGGTWVVRSRVIYRSYGSGVVSTVYLMVVVQAIIKRYQS